MYTHHIHREKLQAGTFSVGPIPTLVVKFRLVSLRLGRLCFNNWIEVFFQLLAAAFFYGSTESSFFAQVPELRREFDSLQHWAMEPSAGPLLQQAFPLTSLAWLPYACLPPPLPRPPLNVPPDIICILLKKPLSLWSLKSSNVSWFCSFMFLSCHKCFQMFHLSTHSIT